MIKKISKHFLILLRRKKQNKELRSISKYDNETLKKIIESFLTVKNSKFSGEDISAFENCERYRQRLLNDKTPISYEVFGSDKKEIIKDICKKAASSKKWCQLIYFISKKTDTTTFLEIGTNLGISGSYILEALKNQKESKFITMEGLPKLCDISSDQFSTIVSTDRYEVKQGLYDTTFPILLKEDILFNTLFIDGNHLKNPTIEYFNKLKSRIVSPAIFIFDDINWSEEMKEAWNIIKNDDDVNYSIDLYKQGIVIIDTMDSRKNIGFELHLAY